MTNAEIMERTGYSPWHTEKALKRLGLHPNRKLNYRHQQMLRLYQGGALDTEIAEAVGIARRSVADWRIRNGLLSNWKQGGKKE